MKKIFISIIFLCIIISLCSCNNSIDLSGIESKIDNIQRELQEKDNLNVVVKNDDPISVDIKKENYISVHLTSENVNEYIAINVSIQDVEINRYEQANSIGRVETLYDLYMVVKVETTSKKPDCIFDVGFTSFSLKVYDDEPCWKSSKYSSSTIDNKGNSVCTFILYKEESLDNKFLDISPVRVQIDYPYGFVKVPTSQQ